MRWRSRRSRSRNQNPLLRPVIRNVLPQKMTVIACDDRRKLRDAIVAYMNCTISTYAFDDLNSECMDSRDESVRQISRQLYQIHDDAVDHPISVTQPTWNALIRVVAFLDTDSAGCKDATNNEIMAIQRRIRMEYTTYQPR
ncbi:MAG: hypothetical protein KDB27_12210 [Planctomycetales bacterium]|nr:hypothetical protein [Planctomycetales bacterium]